MKKLLKSKSPRDAELAFNRTLRFLTIRPRSRWEVEQYLLMRLKADRASVQAVLSRVQRLDFVNDETFAAWWVDKALRVRPRSLALLRLELKRKSVAQDVIDRIVSRITQGESQHALDFSTAINLLKKQEGRLKGLMPEDRFRRAVGFLSRRGFSFDVVKKAISTFDNPSDDFVQ